VVGYRSGDERVAEGHDRLRAGGGRLERANVIDALRGVLELRFGEHPEASATAESEPLELVIGA
jgi:hypothetical protein